MVKLRDLNSDRSTIGVDEKLKMQVGPKSEPIKGDVLNFDEVMDRMDHFMDWLAKQYVTALNIIHYMHDK